MVSQVIQSVRILEPSSGTDRVADVWLADGYVKAIGDLPATLPGDGEVINGEGCVLAPGLVDLHSTSAEPGFESRETLHSLRHAAIAGGFSRVGILPNTRPTIDTPAMVARILSTNAPPQPTEAWPQFQVWAALTQTAKGEQMTELAELATAGIVGFSDGQPIANPTLLRRILDYARMLDKPIALWPCNRALSATGVVRDGEFALMFGLSGVPIMAESSPLAFLLEIVAEVGTPVHIMRVSTARSVQLIQRAKEQGLPVTASTTWMHLLFSAANLGSYDPNLRLDPPLGNPKDQQALIEAVKTGIVDAIAVDHSPYTYEEKTVAFGASPPGAIGLELALPLLWHTFVESGTWTALELWSSLSTRPAQCWRTPPPQLQVDQATECVLFDPNEIWTVQSKTLKSLSSNTPWLGQSLQGRVCRLWTPG